jgi:hypothetical protein
VNTIRELKQQEKYKNMLKRKNKEKKIYKDKNASLQFEKQKLYIALLNREKEIERLNNIINELEEYICALEYDERHSDSWQIPIRIHNKLKELKGDSSNGN